MGGAVSQETHREHENTGGQYFVARWCVTHLQADEAPHKNIISLKIKPWRPIVKACRHGEIHMGKHWIMVSCHSSCPRSKTVCLNSELSTAATASQTVASHTPRPRFHLKSDLLLCPQQSRAVKLNSIALESHSVEFIHNTNIRNIIQNAFNAVGKYT